MAAAANLERLKAFQLLQWQVKQLIVEGVRGLAIVLALAQHVWQQQLMVGVTQGLGLGLLGVAVLLSEAKLGRVIQRRRQGSSQPTRHFLIGVLARQLQTQALLLQNHRGSQCAMRALCVQYLKDTPEQ